MRGTRSATPLLTGLARGCHPGPTVVVTAVTALLSIVAGASWQTAVLATVTVLTGQLSIGWANDWLDAERDATRGDKPTATGAVRASSLRTAAFIALAATVLLSLSAGPTGLWQLLLVGSGWTYNLGVKATPWSPAPFAVGFGALPVYTQLMSGADVTGWLVVGGAILGVAAHFANAAPDVELDRSHGILGLPQRVGTRGSWVIASALLAVAVLLAVTRTA